LTKAIDDLVKEVAASIDAYFEYRRSNGQDATPFFKSADHEPEYQSYLTGPGSEFGPAIKARVAQLVAVLKT
jgi:hypothetical protein